MTQDLDSLIMAYAKAVAGIGCDRGSDFYDEIARGLTAILPKLWRPAETQKTISKWAEETFGPVGSNASVAARANQEMSELLRSLAGDDSNPKAIEEAADVVICLYRLVERMGGDLLAEIDRKMQVNLTRKWELDGDGHGRHVKGR
jgi:hypothetical protein